MHETVPLLPMYLHDVVPKHRKFLTLLTLTFKNKVILRDSSDYN